MKGKICILLAVIFAQLPVQAVAQGNLSQAEIHGIFESLNYAYRGQKGIARQVQWNEYRLRFDDHFDSVFSDLQIPGINSQTDEGYLRYQNGPVSIRAGRIRPTFGFADWSELVYNPIALRPIVRAVALSGSIGVSNQASGPEITLSHQNFQLQLAVLDTKLSDLQLIGEKHDHIMARAQITEGSTIVGLNLMSGAAKTDKVYGIDARWTAPHLQIRGELIRGEDNPNGGDGYYVDCFYRLPGFPRTQLAMRRETFMVSHYDTRTVVNTLGIRHVVCPYLTLTLNYVWGDHLDGSSYVSGHGEGGWIFAPLVQIRF